MPSAKNGSGQSAYPFEEGKSREEKNDCRQSSTVTNKICSECGGADQLYITVNKFNQKVSLIILEAFMLFGGRAAMVHCSYIAQAVNYLALSPWHYAHLPTVFSLRPQSAGNNSKPCEPVNRQGHKPPKWSGLCFLLLDLLVSLVSLGRISNP